MENEEETIVQQRNLPRYLLTNKWSVITIALFCSVLWGSSFPTLKLSYLELNIASDNTGAIIILAGMRFFLAAILLWVLVTFGIKKSLKVPIKKLGELILLGVLQISLTYYFFYNGLAHIQGMKGAILQSFGTFLVVLLAHFVYTNDKLNWKKWLGLATGFAGIVLANFGKSLDLSFTWQGEGFLLLSGVATAFGTLLAKHLSRDVHPFVVTSWQMLIGSILLISIGLPQLGDFTFTFTSKAWILLIYSSFLSATAFSLWYSLLKYNKAGEISIYRFMVPVSGAILSASFIPGEKPTYMMGFALVLVAIGIISVNYQKT